VSKGSNHGWPYFEGSYPTAWTDHNEIKIKSSQITRPVWEFQTGKKPSAVIGGVAYRDEDTGLVRYLCGNLNGRFLEARLPTDRIHISLGRRQTR
jgi:hypothetical protein